MKTLKEQWDEVTQIKVFEIPVLDRRTNEADHIIFDISIDGDTFEAQHPALNQYQAKSNKIAYISIDIDDDFNLDHHLQELYDACVMAILESEFFELTD